MPASCTRETTETPRRELGGVKVVADLLNQTSSKVTTQILESIEKENADLATSIRNQMFTFEDFIQVADAGIRELLAQVDKKTLAIALKNASEELKAHFFKSMSSRAVEMLKEDTEALGRFAPRTSVRPRPTSLQPRANWKPRGSWCCETTQRKKMPDSNHERVSNLWRRRSLFFTPPPAAMIRELHRRRRSNGFDGQESGSESSPLRSSEQKAYERGLAEGKAGARAEFEKAAAEMRSQISGALRQFSKERADYFGRVEAEVVRLSLSIARKILHRESQIDPLVLTGVVHVALQKLNSDTRVRLRANRKRSDFGTTISSSPRISFPQSKSWAIRPLRKATALLRPISAPRRSALKRS